MGIDETGTNYPPEIYDPAAWTSDDFFEAIGSGDVTRESESETEMTDASAAPSVQTKPG